MSEVKVNNATFFLDPNKNWLENLFLKGFFQETPLCTGIGRCGKCKIKFLSNLPLVTDKEKEILSCAELREGFRLACEHFPQDNQNIIYDYQNTRFEHNYDLKQIDILGIDIGTTTLKWGGFDSSKNFLFLGQKINPQMGAGAEVLSRVSFALENDISYLQEIILKDIQLIWNGFKGKIGIVGNTVMMYLLLGENIKELSYAPFQISLKGGIWRTLKEKKIYIPPFFGAFVGADISAGLAYIEEIKKPKYPYLFCDFGTNGEIVLVKDKDDILCTSVALGPALEGIGLRFGASYNKEAISSFFLSLDGINGFNKKEKFRITGTGYLSLIDIFLKIGIVNRDGHFNNQFNFKRLKNNLRDSCFYLTKYVFIDEKDIEEILKVKAAINLGIIFLLNKAKLKFNDISSVWISGVLGCNLVEDILINLGFFPFEFENKIKFIENSALKGLCLILADKTIRKNVEEWLQKSTYYNLSNFSDFLQYFVKAMNFNFWRNNS
ncbi:Uncharacterized 2Fe-2 and 4Fe-4S clusters-containing protein, contains DUF4445 domain [Desulfonauticus submarinus]|uniref:Uncharacterized 2Fe-2 and 4Fe-4S clusters-containing protein, contains DUF4445 domain n=1 Tax=Desulfonauticus submarinus TaxID=206665 RepID=A0A1H0G3Q8_9BACT|nr:ASKHA domain-containing protein [Desulfonauticus submarinus]SDO01480.1 Uncharacterized 2Fe-2 and 4Fe-4S clusters-containing protein, contains DUF4445 domain [Desulfonauticus submarinus]